MHVRAPELAFMCICIAAAGNNIQHYGLAALLLLVLLCHHLQAPPSS